MQILLLEQTGPLVADWWRLSLAPSIDTILSLQLPRRSSFPDVFAA
jgi:hypothetical protein